MRLPAAPLVLAAVVLTALSAVVAIGLGAVRIPAADVVAVVGHHLHLLGADPSVPPASDFIVWQLRAPRVLQAVVVGAGLAVAGAVVQVVVANTIADPYVLGLSSGAGVGAVVVLTTAGATAAGSLTLPLAAFGGALVAGALVFAAARTSGRLEAGRLVLVGIALGYLLSGVTSFILLTQGSGDAVRQVVFWLLGSLAGAQWRFAVVTTLVVAACVAALVAGAGRLDLLAVGDEAATALGLSPHRARVGFFVVTALLVGTVVSVSGSVGFVGLVVPNLVRILVGADHRRVLPLCAGLGGLLVLWADTGARLVLAPTELPLGIVTAAIGVPAFVVAVRRGRASTMSA